MELAVALAVTTGLVLIVGAVGRDGDVDGSCFSSRLGAAFPPEPVERTFVFADLVGFTALAEARGDRATAVVADRFAWLGRMALQGDAVLVKTMGDALLIAASAPAAALGTALTLRRLVEAEPRFPDVAVGVHQGTAVALDGDYFGSALNVAARVAEQARAGQVLCTEPVAGGTAGLSSGRLEPLGLARLKNVSEAAVLYAVLDENIGARRVDERVRQDIGGAR